MKCRTGIFFLTLFISINMDLGFDHDAQYCTESRSSVKYELEGCITGKTYFKCYFRSDTNITLQFYLSEKASKKVEAYAFSVLPNNEPVSLNVRKNACEDENSGLKCPLIASFFKIYQYKTTITNIDVNSKLIVFALKDDDGKIFACINVDAVGLKDSDSEVAQWYKE